jgi:hypothetical protein
VGTFARIYFFDFNDAPDLPSHGLDGEKAKSAITNKRGLNKLSHIASIWVTGVARRKCVA